MKMNWLFITGMVTIFMAAVAQEQVPTFNIKNKTSYELIMVIGIQNTVKNTVIMRIKNSRTRKAVDYAYTVGDHIVLNPEEDVSVYGLNIEEVQALDCYYTMNNMQKKVVAQFYGDYKTMYLKYTTTKDRRVLILAQEGDIRGKTTDKYSLGKNIKNNQITLLWPKNAAIVTKQKMHVLDTVDDYVAIIPLERAAQQIYE